MNKATRNKSGMLKKNLLATAGLSAVGFLAIMPQTARALNLYDGSNSGNELQINLSTTISYAGFYRVNNPSSTLAGPANANGSEGDLNFQHGVVGNQIEALPVLDVQDGNYGAHLSGEFYLNTVYLQHNQNDQPSTFNPDSTTNNKSFTSATRNINGENARLLDAFVYGQRSFANDQTLSLKFGRQTLLWGQSLLFANNGISAGQAPIDILTAESLPNPQSQQVFLPVGQAVLTYRPNIGALTFQAYYQFEYQHDVFQGVGAYFNSADILDKGGQRIIAGPGSAFGVPGGAYLTRAKDLTPPIENGQFGAAVQDTFGNYDLGLYGLRYDAKAPVLYAAVGPGFGSKTPGGTVVGQYQLVYPRDIQIYGGSFSTTIGPANVAGEISTRRNMPLVAGLTFVPSLTGAGASAGRAYPVGNTVQAQMSTLYISPGIPLDPGGVSVTGEVEFNHVLSVTANKAAMAAGRQASAAAAEVILTPTYYEVLPNLEVTFPIGISYNFLGRSQIDASMQHGTGTFTVGITGTYNTNWTAGLTYKDYLGKADASYNGLADRGYVALNLQHTF